MIQLTFGDLELVVLLVPQTASLAVDDPDREVRVRTVGRLQAEIRGCGRKERRNNEDRGGQNRVGLVCLH